MTDPDDSPDLLPLTEPAELPPPPRKKGHPLLAWAVIVGVVAFLLWRSWATRQAAGEDRGERASSIVLRLQGRYVVGAAGFVPAGDRKKLYDQLTSLNTGPVRQRLRFVVLAGELQGPDEALRQLDGLRARLGQDEVKGEPEDVALVDVLERLYRDSKEGHPDAPSVTAEERERLRERLGWFGDLALAPEGGPKDAREAALAPARRTAVALIAGVSGLAAVGLFGFAALVPFLVLLFAGRLRSGITGPFLYGGVYAEAFAVWMVLFVGLSFAAARVNLPGKELLVHAAVDLLSLLAALAWPLLRGVPWGQMRRDVGLTLGRSPALEPLLGVACYAMAIPLLVGGALLTFELIRLQNLMSGGRGEVGAAPNLPVHPIVQVVGDPDWRVLVQLLLLASVAAPIVEETMFRGLLYRQLRESTGGWGRAGSILASAGAVSFLFAAIHPQGWTAIPALMALAIAFSLMREWRGTLIPCMIAHGINNGLVILCLHFALGS
jgi:membrane protease YdiL (CAAX protease family)